MEVTREEARKIVQEAIEENRDRIRAEKAEAALQAANEAWDRAWEKAMPRYQAKEVEQRPMGIVHYWKPREEEAERVKEAGAWRFLYGVCTGALGVLIITCTVILTRML